MIFKSFVKSIVPFVASIKAFAVAFESALFSATVTPTPPIVAPYILEFNVLVFVPITFKLPASISMLLPVIKALTLFLVCAIAIARFVATEVPTLPEIEVASMLSSELALTSTLPVVCTFAFSILAVVFASLLKYATLPPIAFAPIVAATAFVLI